MAHSLEIKLREAIKRADESSACTFIDLINNYSGWFFRPTLKTLDSDGRSFLALALHQNLTSVYTKLFELQKNDYSFLFANDRYGCSIIFYAAEIGCVSIVEHIINISEKITAGPGYKIWLAMTKENKTLLHFPYFHANTFFLVLEKIAAEKDFLNFINTQTAFEQHTPLHDICLYSPQDTNHYEAFARAERLVQLGADLTLKNNAGLEAFCVELSRLIKISDKLEDFIKYLAKNGFFIGRTIPWNIYNIISQTQYAFFATKYYSVLGKSEILKDINLAFNEVLQADAETQEVITKNCYYTLQRDPSSVQLKDFYNRLKNLRGLKALIIETCERNDEYVLPSQPTNLPENLVERLPRYTQRLKANHLFFKIEADDPMQTTACQNNVVCESINLNN